MKKLKMLLGLLLGTMILTSCSSDLLNTNVDGPMTRSAMILLSYRMLSIME